MMDLGEYTVRAGIMIDRPPEDVFASVANSDNDPASA